MQAPHDDTTGGDAAASRSDPGSAVRSGLAVSALRDDLSALTVDGLSAICGTAAVGAADRGDPAPLRRGLRRAGYAMPIAVLARAFLLGDAVAAASLAAALPALGIAGAESLGLVRVDGELARPLVALRPYRFGDGYAPDDGWIASDLDELAGVFPLRPDHVLGVGGAGRTLAALLPEHGTGRALDLGCGCGILSLHLRRRGFEVTATDVSRRALWFTGLNAALNGLDGIEVRAGSLFDPVAGEQFDLIASNPPFVITPRAPGVPRYEYRDGGADGDALMAAVVAGAGAHLTERGQVRLLGNWEEHAGAPGLDRVRTWAGARGAWVIERELLDPVRYAELWVRDGGTRPGTIEHDELVTAWLDDFETRGVEAIGMGWIVLNAADPALARYERLGAPVDHGQLAGHVTAALAVHERLAATSDAEVAASTLLVAADVTEARHHLPGAEGPSVIELRQGGGLGRTIPVDSALAALVGACDGELPLGALIDAIAELLEADAAALRADLVPRVRELLFAGFLEFA